MKSTNRRWQSHLSAKGIIPFFLDRLVSHAMSSNWQYSKGPFYFPIKNRETDDELTRSFFEFIKPFPYDICIEITNACNLACKMCARNRMKRKRGFMSNRLFKKIIDEIAEKQPYAYLHYYGIGESFLDRSLFWKLNYARKKGLKNSIIFTNGQLLIENNNYKKIVDSGVAIIGVDLDGFSQKIYGSIRIGGKFNTAKKGIEKLDEYIKARGYNTRLEIAYQIYPGINEGDIKPFASWCSRQGYEYKLVTMHTWAGLRSDIPRTKVKGLSDEHHLRRSYPCCALWSSFMIAWDGRVGLCFQDADIREPLGDIRKQSIENVWKGKHLKKRREHFKGIFAGICKSCDSYSAVKMPKICSRLYVE